MGAQIVIVGGGFSGVAVAWNLLMGLRVPATIHLINKGALGRGLAYGTPLPHHLLNVPAGRMGLDPRQEDGFVRYLHGLGLGFSGGDFVPRTLYGAYLEWCLGDARAAGVARGVRLKTHNGTVHRIDALARGPQGSRRSVWVDPLGGQGAQAIEADSVVLALGNFASQPPGLGADVSWDSPGLVASPWSTPRLGPEDLHAPVLLLGNGLTAYDVLLQLRHEGHRGPVTMLSRRGLRAQAHRPLETPPPQDIVPGGVLDGQSSVSAMLHEIRQRVREAQACGHDWRDVIGGLRPLTPRLWQQLPEREQRRFLRHLAPFWDTHRHRAAVPIARQVDAERAAGRLNSLAGRIHALTREGSLWRVDIALRGQARLQTERVARVINCTGPSSDVRAVQDALLQSLLARGMLAPDPLALGVMVDDGYHLLNAQGVGQGRLRYVGPLLKAGLWEATAVPELRQHARAVAVSIMSEIERAQ